MLSWKRTLPWSGSGKYAVDSLAGTACLRTEAEWYTGVRSDLASPYRHLLDQLQVCHTTSLYLIFPASEQGINILIPVYKRLCDPCVVITWAIFCNFVKYCLSEKKWHMEFLPKTPFSQITCLNTFPWHQMLDLTFPFLILVLNLFIEWETCS